MDERHIIAEEYTINKLNNIHDYLWIAGRKENINPIHKQICMRRDILIVEDISLHMIWYDNIIYLKPLKKIIIDEYLNMNDKFKNNNDFLLCINGFLKSYIKLIKTKSDFIIAYEKKLIDEDITWNLWKVFYSNFIINLNNINCNKRYEYGELRLYRLNLIYQLTFRGLSYFNIYRQYNIYFNKYFQVSILLFAYLTMYLTAMQVMLASTNINYYNFGLFSIIIVSVIIISTFAIFFFIFIYNLIATLKNKLN